MAPQPTSIQTLSSYLTTGYWYDTGALPHHFTSGDISVNISGLSQAGQTLARAALEAWETIANIDFTLVTGGSEIVIDNNASGAVTNAIYYSNGSTDSAHVNVSPTWLINNGTTVGSESFKTFMHEIGHALGLGHTGSYDDEASYSSDALFQNDSWQTTVMSYFDQDENTHVNATRAVPVTLMMADIFAIQQLYGAAQGGPTVGQTTWGIGSDLGAYLDKVFQGANAGLVDRAMTIWDVGGTDTVNFSNDTRTQRVDLGAGRFSNVYGEVGNVGIALGTVIENYVAGSAGDHVLGNAANNRIELRAGNDTVNGLAGNDTLLGGEGADRMLGGVGNDQISGGSLDDSLWGEAGNDVLTGGFGNDVLTAGRGQDVLVGGTGKDLMYGGTDAARDVFVFNYRSDSSIGNADVIINFTRALTGGDDIDLRAIDARASTAGVNDAFRWSGTTAAAHSIWWVDSGADVKIRGDVTGDQVADFEILVKNVTQMASFDFLL